MRSETECKDTENELVYAAGNRPISESLNFSPVQVYAGAKQNCSKHNKCDLCHVPAKQQQYPRQHN